MPRHTVPQSVSSKETASEGGVGSAIVGTPRFERNGCVLVTADARNALPTIPDQSVSCTITSPPYGRLKDYGSSGQIGFGQKYDAEYLPSLDQVMRELYRVSKPGAALWMVLDMLKEEGEMTPLPWQVVELARNIGWTFHDLVIWDKGRSLPWSHRGRFRNVFESVLLLGKGRLRVFDLNVVRESGSLGPYWVRYPERYHPDGKAPSDLWHFPIPVQGSWGNDSVRHSCPFPIGLVARMVALTSRPGDVILDPFAGSGSVPATASAMGRIGVGIELNRDFVDAFSNGVHDSMISEVRDELQRSQKPASLRETIVDLRMQKFAKTLFTELSRSDRMNGTARSSIQAFVIRSGRLVKGDWQSGVPYHLAEMELDILAGKGADTKRLKELIAESLLVRPLSKFGVKANIVVKSHKAWANVIYAQDLPRGPWFSYRNGRFFALHAQIQRAQLHQTLLKEAADTKRKVPPLFSRLKLEITPPDSG